jgi:hypothetical protein
VNNRNLIGLLAGWLLSAGSGGAQTAPTPPKEEAVEMSPFVVNTDKDNGFAALSAGTATRLSLDMREVPVPYSVMTREFIDALGITDAQEAASWAPNASAPAPSPNSQDALQEPTRFNVRGVDSSSGQQRNGYLTASVLQSYAMERYDFGRGPNAALFNVGSASTVTGGMGAQTKRARYDRDFNHIAFTYGSWDYMRSTIDLNRALTDKLAVRANALWLDRNGWRMNEFEQTKGLTATGSYRLTPKTELRLEGAYDRVQRSLPATAIIDGVTGWDGITVFRGPVTNAVFGTQTTPGVPNSLGHVLSFQGEVQGVNRVSSQYYVWDPFSGQNLVMNYQNEAYTRRGDETARTPILANGVLYTRGTGLPFGNGATANAFPAFNANPDPNVNLLYQPNLPADRFNRAIAGSNFRLPSKRFTNAFSDTPILVQVTKDVNVTLSHQVGNRWFFEIGADVNEVASRTIRNGVIDSRLVSIDINQILPNGAPNPHYLDPYVDAPVAFSYRSVLNKGARANLGSRHNAGRWGDYTLNLNVALNERTTENTIRPFSMTVLSDPRMWQSAADQVNIRYHWSAPTRPYGETGVPTTLHRNVFASDNNSFTTTTQTVAPRWILRDWGDQVERFDNAVLAASAKYFDGKLVALIVPRFDRFNTKSRSRVEFGDLPRDWDGHTFYYKPVAPADWAKLTYIPRNATNGVATSTVPIPAATRPRVNEPGVTTNNGVQIPNPFFANDRFRNDYSPPENTGGNLAGSYGFVYHALKWLSVVANYGSTYVPPPTNAFSLNNEVADPTTGFGYDGGLRFRFFHEQLTVNANYFYNEENRQRVTPPTTTAINGLLSRNAASDPSVDGRNIRGVDDVFGTDYQSLKTYGAELEVVGRITRGWRVVLNAGTTSVFTFNRYPLTKVFVPENADLYRQILEDAGGRLDSTQHPNGAPGLAVVNTAVSAALATEQTNAVANYNNIWAQYAAVQNDRAIAGQNRVTANLFSDYTLQSGWARGVRFGLGARLPGRIYVGSRSADSIVDPTNPTRAIDDPSVDSTTPVYMPQPLLVSATLGYTMKLRRGWRVLEGKELQFQLVIRNLLNNQAVVYNGLDVVARPPNGDFSQPNRVTVAPRVGRYTEPTSLQFTTTLKL